MTSSPNCTWSGKIKWHQCDDSVFATWLKTKKTKKKDLWLPEICDVKMGSRAKNGWEPLIYKVTFDLDDTHRILFCSSSQVTHLPPFSSFRLCCLPRLKLESASASVMGCALIVRDTLPLWDTMRGGRNSENPNRKSGLGERAVCLGSPFCRELTGRSSKPWPFTGRWWGWCANTCTEKSNMCSRLGDEFLKTHDFTW